MQPLLDEDDEVLVDERAHPSPGDVVVARHPFKRGTILVKRLEDFDERGYARLVGTNPSESTDSRTLGAVPPELLKGRVCSALRPKQRR